MAYLDKETGLTLPGSAPGESGGGGVDLSFITAEAEDIRAGKVGASPSGGQRVGTLRASFYKCSSVDTANKSWSGYRAVLTEGVYTFEESITAGLSYTAVTPVIERVYTADALCEIKSLYNGIPVDGLVFYAPLTKASSVAETGQALITSGNVTYDTVDGIPCAYFDGNATIYMPDDDKNILRLPTGNMPGTISLRFKSTAAQYASIMNYCGENRTSRGIWLNTNGNITLDDGSGNLSDTVGFCDDANHFNGIWCHAIITYNGTTLKLYVDGIEKSSVDYELNTGAMRFGIGAWAWGHITHYFTGYVAAVRVYDRVVTAREIQQLAGEFEPYAGIVTPYAATSNEYGDWKISSLTELHSGHAPWKAFGDFDTGHEWHSDWRGSLSSDNNEWIQWQNTRYMIRVDEYTLVNRSNGGCHALDWTFEGSNDGEHWTVLDTVSRGSASTGESLTRQIPQENRGEYSYHRINITRSDDTYVTIGLITAKGEFTREI